MTFTLYQSVNTPSLSLKLFTYVYTLRAIFCEWLHVTGIVLRF